MTKIIGLAGRRGSGKDTVANLMGWERVAFADTLRDAATAICGFSREQMLDPALKEKVDPRWGWSPRWFLQHLGTEVGRAIDPNLWVRAWEHKVRNKMQPHIDIAATREEANRLWDKGDKAGADYLHEKARRHSQTAITIVATDVRFPNEVVAVRALGGKVYRVVRPWGGLEVNAVDAHPSEHALDDTPLDGEILNAGSLEDLKAAVQAAGAAGPS